MKREIAVIAIVKDITGMGMMAVKKLIATAPCIIKENMTEEEAKAARDRLLEVGAKVKHLSTWNVEAHRYQCSNYRRKRKCYLHFAGCASQC